MVSRVHTAKNRAAPAPVEIAGVARLPVDAVVGIHLVTPVLRSGKRVAGSGGCTRPSPLLKLPAGLSGVGSSRSNGRLRRVGAECPGDEVVPEPVLIAVAHVTCSCAALGWGRRRQQAADRRRSC